MMEPPALPPDPRKSRVRLALLALLIVGLAVSIVLVSDPRHALDGSRSGLPIDVERWALTINFVIMSCR